MANRERTVSAQEAEASSGAGSAAAGAAACARRLRRGVALRRWRCAARRVVGGLAVAVAAAAAVPGAVVGLGVGEALAQSSPAATGVSAEGASADGAGAGAAAPQPGRVALVYQLGKGTFGCEKEATFRQWVAGNLHGDPFVLVGPPAYRLEVRIEREPPGFRGVAELRDAEGRVVMVRETLERTCIDVVDRMVVVVLLSVFPPAPPPAPAAPAAPPAPVAEPPSGCGPCEDAVRRERDARRAEIDELKARVTALHNDLQEAKRKGYGRGMDLTFALAAGALITANLTSNVGPGVWVHGEARSGPLMLGLELRSVIPAHVTVGARGFDLSQAVALLTPCGRYSYFFGCAVAGAGVQVIHDSKAIQPTGPTVFDPLVQLGGRVGVEVPFGDSPFAGRAWGEVLYSTPHTVINYTDIGSRWDRPDVSAFFGLGFVVKLGDEGAR